jgi:acyl-CoA synthetase (AMP-forming)/AMP-acid ligase II
MNIASLLLQAVDRWPDNHAVSWGSQRLTYREFGARVTSLAAGLRTAGLERGDRVAVLMHNRPQLLESLWACWHSGCVAVPINARSSRPESATIFADAGVAAIIYSDEFDDHIAQAGCAPSVVRVRISDADAMVASQKSALDYEALLSSALLLTGPVDVESSELAWLFYTSGTTGALKGAMLSHLNLTSMISHFLTDVYRTSQTDRLLHLAPLTHGGGLYSLPAMLTGAAQVISAQRSFQARNVWETVSAESITGIPFLAPTMLNILSRETTSDAVAGLRFVIYGGGPISATDLRRAINIFGSSLIQIYGQGEAPMSITTLSSNGHLAAAGQQDDAALISAGYPFTTTQVGVMSLESDVLLPYGARGEIVTRGPVVMSGYWQNEDATKNAFCGSWLRTGDIGFQAEDGRLTLLDRSKDVIISGGSNIYPREVEEVLLRHPAVQEGLVVGAPDEHWGEAVVAVLVVTAEFANSLDAIEAELQALCRIELADYKKPRRYVWVDQIPKNAYGKLVRREVRELFWTGTDRSV